jgi:hypothetical protein
MRITSVVFGITIGEAVSGSSGRLGGSGKALDVEAEVYITRDKIETSPVGKFCGTKMPDKASYKVTRTELEKYSGLVKSIVAEGVREKNSFCRAIDNLMTGLHSEEPVGLLDALDQVMEGIDVLDEKAPCLRGHCDPPDVLAFDKWYPDLLGNGEICQFEASIVCSIISKHYVDVMDYTVEPGNLSWSEFLGKIKASATSADETSGDE